MHLSLTLLTALAVFFHLGTSIAASLLKDNTDRQKINDLNSKVNQVLGVVTAIAPVLPASVPLKGLLRLVTSPYLPSQNAWFLLDTKRPVRAVFLQMRREFEFEALEMNSETGFLRDKYLYGVRGRYNVGYGDWRCAYGSQGT